MNYLEEIIGKCLENSIHSRHTKAGEAACKLLSFEWIDEKTGQRGMVSI